MEEGEGWCGEGRVFEFRVGVGEQEAGDRVFSGTRNSDTSATGYGGFTGEAFTGSRDLFFAHVFRFVFSLLRDRAGHLPPTPVQILFLQRLNLLRPSHPTVVLVLVDLWRSAS